MYPWRPAPLPSPFAWPAAVPIDSIATLFNPPVVAPLFNAPPVFRPAYDPVSGLPLIYRPMNEWQELARTGALRPDDQLYDPDRGTWQRAND